LEGDFSWDEPLKATGPNPFDTASKCYARSRQTHTSAVFGPFIRNHLTLPWSARKVAEFGFFKRVRTLHLMSFWHPPKGQMRYKCDPIMRIQIGGSGSS